MALSAKGTTAVVGGYRDNRYAGAVWVFIRKGIAWIDQRKLIAPTTGAGKEISGAYFGYSLALSPGGNTVLIGGPNDGPSGDDAGGAWVFTRIGTTWTEMQKLTGPTSGPDTEIGSGTFGSSVASSSDGKMALIGGDNDDGGVGASWEFTLQPAFLAQPSTWDESQKVTVPLPAPTRKSGPADLAPVWRCPPTARRRRSAERTTTTLRARRGCIPAAAAAEVEPSEEGELR